MEFGWQLNVCPIAEWWRSAEVNHEANLADGHSHPEGWAPPWRIGSPHVLGSSLSILLYIEKLVDLVDQIFSNVFLNFYIYIIAFMLIFFLVFVVINSHWHTTAAFRTSKWKEILSGTDCSKYIFSYMFLSKTDLPTKDVTFLSSFLFNNALTSRPWLV